MIVLYCNVCSQPMGIARSVDFRRKVCSDTCKNILRRYKRELKAVIKAKANGKAKGSHIADARVQGQELVEVR